MAGNTFGHSFRITTWGESHGKALGAVVDGTPAGLPLDEADIQKELDRRRPGQSAAATPRKEKDRVEILSGVFEGITTGTPISLIVYNKDANSSSYDKLRNKPRPGHADFGYMEKYGHRDHRGGGRSSGRETLGRVAAGAIAKKLLVAFGIEVVAHVIELGGIRAENIEPDIKTAIEKNPVRCADPSAATKMLEMVEKMRSRGESTGGIVEILTTGVPAGLGEPVFNKIDADIAAAMMGIGAVKGIEFGAGFKAARMRGSEMNDAFEVDNETIKPLTNNAGGVLGGLTTGMPIVCRCAVKPTPSISLPQHTADMLTKKEEIIEIKGRHDPTIPPRMVPVAEAMMAIVLADHMIQSGRIDPDSILPENEKEKKKKGKD
ncbi:chorismate synthase [Methanohalophilus sp. RSK]|uniref:chorismate synthase n=1 Tax=Methanohalophilus sp. RSK TaxID=2485783 RepID=UPI000F438F6F|nr:chorismate synthase [Methanohalophilus sp. RSK]RNI14518.1 chorismate synthase [Methanohalophilus sp. RSK]